MNPEPDTKREPDLVTKIQTANIRAETLKNTAVIGSIAFAAFMLGLVPMWLSSRANQIQAEATEKVLRARTLQNSLATATIQARRGDFEPARQQASDFFTGLHAELGQEQEESAFDTAQGEALRGILAQRDETITLLARSETRGADKLSELYFELKALSDSAVQKE